MLLTNFARHEQYTSFSLTKYHTTHLCLNKYLDSITPYSSDLSLVSCLEEDNNDYNNGKVTY